MWGVKGNSPVASSLSVWDVVQVEFLLITYFVNCDSVFGLSTTLLNTMADDEADIAGSPVLRDLDKFEMVIQGSGGPSEHPDVDYIAFRQMGGARVSGWDGDCYVYGIRRTAAGGDSLSDWASNSKDFGCDYDGECDAAETDAELLGKTAAQGLADAIDKDLDLGSWFAGLLSDSVEEIQRKVALLEYQFREATTTSLYALLGKCGTLGAAILPDGNAVIVEAHHLNRGGNSRGAVFATAEWFFGITMDMS